MKKIPIVCAALLLAAAAAGCARKTPALQASGTVEVREVDLASRISSRVDRLLAREGQSVRKGEILAHLDDRLVAAQKETAQAVYTQVNKSFQRSKSLYESKSITQEQFDAASAQYTRALSDLRQAEILFDEANIVAPWDGVLLERNVEEGELVSVNTPLFTLGDIATARVTIYVPLIDLGKLVLGQEARVTVDSFKDKYFPGKITYISSRAEFTPKNIQTKDERVKDVFAVEV
ncbi:MAG: efflux RND transporter periplasmic adaptor subunit, partial [Endomicrobiales bacterium]